MKKNKKRWRYSVVILLICTYTAVMMMLIWSYFQQLSNFLVSVPVTRSSSDDEPDHIYAAYVMIINNLMIMMQWLSSWTIQFANLLRSL